MAMEECKTSYEFNTYEKWLSITVIRNEDETEYMKALEKQAQQIIRMTL